MKLSSREKLLKEADVELNLIRLKTILEVDSSDSKKIVDKVSKSLTNAYNKKQQKILQDNLEKFRIASETMQRDYEKAKKQGISIDQWYKNQPRWRKNIYELERSAGTLYKGNLWDRISLVMLWITSFIPGSITSDKQGNFYDIDTGEEIKSPEGDGLSPSTVSNINSVFRAFTI